MQFYNFVKRYYVMVLAISWRNNLNWSFTIAKNACWSCLKTTSKYPSEQQIVVQKISSDILYQWM